MKHCHGFCHAIQIFSWMILIIVIRSGMRQQFVRTLGIGRLGMKHLDMSGSPLEQTNRYVDLGITTQMARGLKTISNDQVVYWRLPRQDFRFQMGPFRFGSSLSYVLEHLHDLPACRFEGVRV